MDMSGHVCVLEVGAHRFLVEATLEQFALAFVQFVDSWAVYIPVVVTHEQAQLALRTLIAEDPRFAALVKVMSLPAEQS
jgi:hypothetical protein